LQTQQFLLANNIAGQNSEFVECLKLKQMIVVDGVVSFQMEEMGG